MMMDEETVSISKLSTKELTLPVYLDVVKGYHHKSKEWRSLETASTICLHYFKDETVLTASVESGNQQLTIPLYCDELFEPLPSIPELDDAEFETAEHLLAAQTMPPIVRVTQSWSGGEDENTIEENDELEDFEMIDDDNLGSCLVANRVIAVEDSVMKERVCIAFSAVGKFTTKANPLKRYTAVDLIQLQSLPRRMRVHRNNTAEVGPVPVKINSLQVRTQRTAVCSDLHSGRLFLLPESLQEIQLHVRRSAYRSTGHDLSQHLYGWMESGCLQQVGPEPFHHVFNKPEASSNSSSKKQQTGGLAILMPTATSCTVSDTRDLRKYKTVEIAGTKSGTESLLTTVELVSSTAEENIVARHSKLRRETNQIQTLINAEKENCYTDTDGNDYETVINAQKEDCYTDTDGNDYETVINAQKEDCYTDGDSNDYATVLVVSKNHQVSKGNLEQSKDSAAVTPRYMPLNQLTIEIDSPYAKPNHLHTDQFKRCVLSSQPLLQNPTSQLQQKEIPELERKVASMKKENEMLLHQISQTVDKVDLVTNQIRTLDLHKKPVNEMAPKAFSQQLRSLTNIQVIQLLRNLRLGQYTDKVLEAAVDGRQLEACDRTYLEDVGMEPAHAMKLLTIVKGRLPPGMQWENLLQQN